MKKFIGATIRNPKNLELITSYGQSSMFNNIIDFDYRALYPSGRGYDNTYNNKLKRRSFLTNTRRNRKRRKIQKLNKKKRG